MARANRQACRHPIRPYGHLFYVVPSFSGSKDEEGDIIEYTVDLQPFQVWKRVIHTVHTRDGGELEIVRVKPVIQPYACNCPDFTMRPVHPCKHIIGVMEEFFPEYYVDEL